MSISNEILRIQTAKENLKSSIQRKEVTVPSATKIDGYPPLVDSIGGGEEDPEDAVRFFDYDGTLLYQYSAAEFLQLSAMPANPSHTGLVAQGWNWSLEDAQKYVAEWGYQDIGQMYITESGDTEIDVEFPTGFKRLSPYMRIAVNGTVEIDWGDDSAVETVTGTGLSTNIDRQHTYASDGSYTIVIHVVSGGFAFNTSNDVYSLLHNNQSSSAERNRVYSGRVRAIRIGNNCTLGGYCFNHLCGLEYVTIPNTILGTGSSGFTNCYSLNSLIIPNNMTQVSFTGGNAYALSVVSIPKTIKYLDFGFSSGYRLDRIIFPPNLNYINNLYGNASFTSRDIIIPYRKYKRIFLGKNFEEVLEEETSVPSFCFLSNMLLKEITIPSGFSDIEQNAFQYCYCLKSIELPNTLETIKANCFNACTSLKNINIPTNIKRIESSAFSSCYSIKSLYVPDGVTFNSTIFSSMNALKSIRLPSDLTLNNAVYFYQDYSLEVIEIPVGITAIRSSAFGYCYSLSKVIIPSGVTSIATSAFYSCYSLSELTIPANVTSIGTQAFYNCYGMKEYHFLSTTPPTITSTNVFGNIPSDCIIYVPQGCLEAYQTAQYWSTYASYMQEEPTQTR